MLSGIEIPFFSNLLEEFDVFSAAPDPTAIPGESQLKTQMAMTQFMKDHGNEPRCGRLLLGSLRSLGLGSVDTEARLFVAQCSSAGAAMIRANYGQLKDAMIRGGYITEEDFEADLMRLDDPRFQMPLPMMWSAWGQRV